MGEPTGKRLLGEGGRWRGDVFLSCLFSILYIFS